MQGKHNDHNFDFLEGGKKCLKLPDLARKLIRKSFRNDYLGPGVVFEGYSAETCGEKIPLVTMGG